MYTMVNIRLRKMSKNKNTRLSKVFASMRSKIIKDTSLISLPEIKGITLEEIEKKYGKL